MRAGRAGGQVRVVGLGGDEPVEGSAEVVVAIDGPAGSGKSTVARRVAERAGLRYLDTGATYRALTLALLRRGIPVDDPEAVADAAKAVDLTLELPPGPAGVARVLLDGVEPGPALRTPEVNATVSAVSAVPAVRELLARRHAARLHQRALRNVGHDVALLQRAGDARPPHDDAPPGPVDALPR